MNASWIKGLTVGAVVATAGGAIAGYNMMGQPSVPVPTYAEVLEVQPATEQVAVPREVCKDVEVTHKKDPRDKHRLMGTATGAVIGGVLGNQVGGGNGKTIATVVGAAAGGLAGNKVQERMQSDDTYTTVEKQCETVTDYRDRVIGYDVTYRIGDEEGRARLDSDPGDRIALTDGKLPWEHADTLDGNAS
ncbi:MAG: glycine zipper 2TM domain-containing protein [Pseudomonadales bacterium]|jgi:uncharacterized protein YcfJ